MNLNNDSLNTFASTEDDVQFDGAASYNLSQNSYSRINTKIMCVNQSAKKMASLQIDALVRRGSSSCTIVSNVVSSVIGDDELSGVSASLSVVGGSIMINVTGLVETVLDWCVQFSISKVN